MLLLKLGTAELATENTMGRNAKSRTHTINLTNEFFAAAKYGKDNEKFHIAAWTTMPKDWEGELKKCVGGEMS